MQAGDGDFEAARLLTARALAVSVQLIGRDTRMYDIPLWDSLGQLSVVLAVEEALCDTVTDDTAFEMLKSVPGIAAYIAQKRGT